MLKMTIRAEGEKVVKRMLDKAPAIIRKHLRRGMGTAVMGVQRVAQVYPPPPVGSRYRRTGTLGRRWKTQVQALVGGVRGIIENPTHYAPQVQGEQQAAVHVGRWKPMSQIIREEGPNIEAALGEALQAAIKEMSG